MSKLQAQPFGDVLIVMFMVDSILDESSVIQIGKELNQAIDESEQEKLLMDMGRVNLMTSSMIGQLVKFKKKCDTEKMQLQLCNMSADIKKLFKMTRLDKVFKIAATREKAIKAFK